MSGKGEDFITYTEIVELPAVKVGGIIKFMNAELRKLSPDQLETYAKVMGGVVVYVVRRAVYQEDTSRKYCELKDCFRKPVTDPDEDVQMCEIHKDKNRRGFKFPFNK